MKESCKLKRAEIMTMYSPHNALRDSVCIIFSVGLYVSGGRKRETQIQMEEAVGMRSGASGESLSFLWQILDGSWHFVCDKK